MTKKHEIMLPLKVATQRASQELESLHVRLERVEHALDTVFAKSANALDTQSIAMLQELDMLRQSVGALAAYLAQVSNKTDDTGTAEITSALNAIPLRDMAIRLSGAQKAPPNSGHTELF